MRTARFFRVTNNFAEENIWMLRGREWQEAGECCIMRSFTKYY
jgi:hypothetical protein